MNHHCPSDRVWTRLALVFVTLLCCLALSATLNAQDDQPGLSADEMKLVRAAERHRMKVIDKVIGSVIAVYGEDRRGGGSGVIIDSNGMALTNHHVIMGAGVTGWGGLADGKLYRWELVGTDPGGDVAIIQMRGKEEFPFTPLGDSDRVRVGDWALAMGNPFVLTEDQVPTVTLGIVSGVKRYQPGAGQNQLVYGNCIQVDSSINPGNSGGPLFSMEGRVIGINGRGSFKARGRVNVGLGYAISSNQIKNFIPDLMATKLTEHASLDANFTERNGKVVCSTRDAESPVAKAGLELEDELLEFEGIPIKTAHQFTNLICTLPEEWPTELLVRGKDGKEKRIVTRALGLPYNMPKRKAGGKEGKTPEEKQQIKLQEAMFKLLSASPGKIRLRGVNRKYVRAIVKDWHADQLAAAGVESRPTEHSVLHLTDKVLAEGKGDVSLETWAATDGRFRASWRDGNKTQTFVYDGNVFARKVDTDSDQGKFTEMTLTEARFSLPIVQAIGITAAIQKTPFEMFGSTMLDGSGKAQSRNAYRMKTRDKEGEWFYYWLSQYDDHSNTNVALLKAGSQKNCDEGDGGVTFGDYRTVESWSIPHQRNFVEGLSERVIAKVSTETVEVSPLDESLFETGLSTKEAKEEEKKNDDKKNDYAEEASENEGDVAPVKEQDSKAKDDQPKVDESNGGEDE